MMKKLPVHPQLDMFKTVLTGFIQAELELCLLAKKVDWKSPEEEYASLIWKSWPAFDTNQDNSWAAAGYNMKKWMRLEKQKLIDLIFGWI